MKLTFLGRGAGFYPAEGSTASFFVDNRELFLIDAGESVFHTLLDRKTLDSVSAVNIFITHTHSDHIGSLGSIILYAFAIKKLSVTVITDKNMAFLPGLKQVLKIYGLSRKMYRFADSSEFDGKYSLFTRVRYFKTDHCDELETCGILFETKQGLVIYSGDMRDPAPVVEIVRSGRKIDKLYVDSTNARIPKMHHVSIHQWREIVPPELTANVYCMHINNSQCIAEAQAYGFKVVGVSG